MVETEEREIDGLSVSVTQFPARFGFKMQVKLARIFGPVFGEIVSGVSDKPNKKSDSSSEDVSIMDKDIDLKKLGSAIEKLFNILDESKSESLVFELLNLTRIDKKEINQSSFDMIFAGKYLTLYKILGFVLEVNYKSFFGEGDIGQKIKRMLSSR